MSRGRIIAEVVTTSWGNMEREWWARHGRGWAHAYACAHAEAPQQLGARAGPEVSRTRGEIKN
jgi:hypothetical protein